MGELLQFISDVYASLRWEENTEARHPSQFGQGTTVVGSEPPRSRRSMAASPISGPSDVPTEVAPPSTERTRDVARDDVICDGDSNRHIESEGLVRSNFPETQSASIVRDCINSGACILNCNCDNDDALSTPPCTTGRGTHIPADANDAAGSIHVDERVLSDVVHITVELRDGDGDGRVRIQAVSMGLGQVPAPQPGLCAASTREQRANHVQHARVGEHSVPNAGDEGIAHTSRISTHNTCDDVKARPIPGCQVSYSLAHMPRGRCLYISLRPAHREEEQHSLHHLNLGHSVRRTELSGVAENAAITDVLSNTVGTASADPDTGIQDFDQTLDSVDPLQCVDRLSLTGSQHGAKENTYAGDVVSESVLGSNDNLYLPLLGADCEIPRVNGGDHHSFVQDVHRGEQQSPQTHSEVYAVPNRNANEKRCCVSADGRVSSEGVVDALCLRMESLTLACCEEDARVQI